MDSLPPEVILGMVEQMDMATTAHFMQTTKACLPAPWTWTRKGINRCGLAVQTVRTLLQTYEISICKAKTAGRRGLPPMEHMLCVGGPKGGVVVVSNNTFDAVRELEVRQERISQALRGDFLNTSDPPLLGPLTPRQHEQLVKRLRTSLHHCDHIADIAANTQAGGDSVRAAQIEYIGRLSTDELAALFYAVDMAGFAFVRARRFEAEDPSVWERITVFEECLLRHGSWFLWAHLAGGQENRTKQMMEAGLRELVDWETGKEGMPPGLRMSLVDAYRHRLKGADDDVADVESSLRERLRGQVMMAPPQIGNLAENSTDGPHRP